jgi:hypothetical protein
METQTKPWNYQNMQQGNENELQESLFIHIFQQQNILIDEQRVIDLNPLHTMYKVVLISP